MAVRLYSSRHKHVPAYTRACIPSIPAHIPHPRPNTRKTTQHTHKHTHRASCVFLRPAGTFTVAGMFRTGRMQTEAVELRQGSRSLQGPYRRSLKIWNVNDLLVHNHTDSLRAQNFNEHSSLVLVVAVLFSDVRQAARDRLPEKGLHHPIGTLSPPAGLWN